MEPNYGVLTEWLGYLTAAVAFVKIAKVKAYDPAREFVQRLGRTMDAVEQISRELGDNGGKSIKDSVNRIDRRTLMTDARQAALIASQPEAMFESDVTGHFTTANRALEDITGFSRAHLTGMEWVNVIHPEDRFRVVKEWDHAIKDQRAWIDTCRLLTATGRLLLVRIEAHPMRESIGERNVVGWYGTVCVEEHG